MYVWGFRDLAPRQRRIGTISRTDIARRWWRGDYQLYDGFLVRAGDCYNYNYGLGGWRMEDADGEGVWEMKKNGWRCIGMRWDGMG